MTTICRCEDITEEEILEAIRAGFQTLDELKRRLRLGMGPCQGRTCLLLAARLLAQEKGQRIEDIPWQTSRPPVVPIPLGILAGDHID
jgi:bacterioferritin-associated ferredoxin